MNYISALFYFMPVSAVRWSFTLYSGGKSRRGLCAWSSAYCAYDLLYKAGDVIVKDLGLLYVASFGLQ